MDHTNHTGGDRRGITSLRQLAQDVRPPRDLWPAIAQEISQDAHGRSRVGSRRRAFMRPSRLQWSALAAVVAALTVGVWIGRNSMPAGRGPAQQIAHEDIQNFIAAGYVRDPRYLKERARLVRAVEEKLKTLPPETQTKVTASLTTIRKSIADIQEALGRDPGNALLQELLVNTYQDEMRVLTTVQEAGNAGREI